MKPSPFPLPEGEGGKIKNTRLLPLGEPACRQAGVGVRVITIEKRKQENAGMGVGLILFFTNFMV